MAGARIQLKRGLAAQWTAANTVLLSGEIGYETDTDKFKIGNGSAVWTSLPYFNGNLTGSNLNDLADVTITSAANGDFLRWNGTAWVNDAVNLSTDTVGDYVGSLVAGTGVTLANNSGEGATPTVAIGQAVATNSNVTFNDVIVSGNLTVSGSTTSINTEILTVDDNVIVLNNNVTTAPTENAGIEIERGTSPNVLVRWNETTDKWETTNDGTTYGNIVTTADSGTVTSTMITDGTIVNGDINASAAIALSKLASGTSAQVIVADGSGVPTYATLTGDVTVSNTGVTTITANSVSLGTDTTGDYVQNLVAGTGVTLTNNTGESATPTVAIGQSIGAGDSPTFTGLTINGASVVFEGATANDFETTLAVTDPTADRTVTFQDGTGTVAFTSDVTTHANLTEAHGATGAVVGTTNTQTLTNKTLTSPKVNEDVVLTATATELNVLDGITSSTAELNILDGVTATAAEINTLDGITSSVSELNILDGATLDVNELNILDGATLTTTELNYVDGVTSAIQTQMDLKSPLASPTFTGTVTVPDNTIALGTKTTGDYVATITGGTGVSSTAATTGEGTTHTLSIGQAIATTDSPTFAGLTVNGASVVFEGVTANDFETTLTVTDPTADRTITFPDATTTVVGTDTTQTLTNKTLTSPKVNEDVVLTSTATELNILDGAVLSTTELNYVDGVTSSIQTQLNAKAPLESPTFTGTVVLPSTVNGPSASTSVNLLFPTTGGHITLGGSQTTGNLTIGGGSTRTTGAVNIGTGATTTGTKTVNIGTGSTAGTTEVVVGSSSGATSNVTLNGTVTAANNLVVNQDLTVNGNVIFEGSTADGYETTVTVTDPTADRTITFPDATTTVVGTDTTQTLTNKTLTSPKVNEDVALTASATELNILDGATLSTTELNYVDGVTSAIQTQIDAKAPTASPTFTGTVTLAADPASALQAATKQYVDNVVSGVNFHASVVAATSGNLAGTYSNGTSGVGATLTKATNGAIGTIDGATVVVGSRILLKSQTDAKENGIYTVTAVGSVSAPWVVTRAIDADNNPSGELANGDFCFVTGGSTNGGYGYINSSTANPIVIGTDDVTYAVFNAAQIVTGGAGLAFTGNVLDIGTASVNRIVVNANDIDLASGIATIGTYQSVTVDTYGRVTAGTNPTTLSGYGITDAAPINNASFTGTFSAPSGTITSTMITDGTIVNGDINASAAIALSKLASGTSAQVIVANGSGVPTYVTLSGDVTISNTGVATIQADSVALGTDTTGSYVTSLVAGTGITLSNNSGESATPTVAVTANTYDAYGSARNLEIKFLMEVM